MLNESGTLVARYTYNAWGELTYSSGSMAEINPLRYRGYYYDTETGFYYLQSRYYDPVTHRFINADSIASTGQGIIGANMFVYCNNSPVMYSDHTGHILKPFTVAICDGGSGHSSQSATNQDQLDSLPKDITIMLDQMMEAHAQELLDYYTTALQEYRNRGFPNTDAKGAAIIQTLFYFRDQVVDGANWDIKRTSEELTIGEVYIYNGREITAEDAGNIHYGYVGSAVFSKLVLLAGAGYNQYSRSPNISYAPYLFDEPRDFEMVIYGIELYKEGA